MLFPDFRNVGPCHQEPNLVCCQFLCHAGKHMILGVEVQKH